METPFFVCYTMGHETSWNPTATGEAPPTRHPVAQNGQESVGCRSVAWGVGEFRLSVVPDIPGAGPQGSSAPTHPGATPEVVPVAEGGADPAPGEGGAGRRVLDGSLDHPTRCGPHLEALPDPVPSRLYGPPARAIGVELPATRTPGAGAERSGHRALEAVSLARAKKNGSGWARTSRSSMRAGSCSSPMSVRPGLPWARHPCSAIATNGIGSPPSLPSPCLPSGSTWRSISGFTTRTSPGWRWWPSCAPSCTTSVDRSSSSGTEARSTGESWFRTSCAGIRDSTWSVSPGTPRNSTPMNSYGPRPNMPCPTVRPRTGRTWNACSTGAYAESKSLNDFSGHASTPPHCHGQHRRSFHYLPRGQ